MDNTEIYQKLQEAFDGVFLEPVKVTPELSAKDVDEWDSLSHISLVLAIESDFKIRFRVGEVESAKNLAELVEIIKNRLAG